MQNNVFMAVRTFEFDGHIEDVRKLAAAQLILCLVVLWMFTCLGIFATGKF